MPESQYIQYVRQMISDFKAADQQRKTAEEQAQQNYRAKCEAAEAELRRQEDIFTKAKTEATCNMDLLVQRLKI